MHYVRKSICYEEKDLKVSSKTLYKQDTNRTLYKQKIENTIENTLKTIDIIAREKIFILPGQKSLRGW